MAFKGCFVFACKAVVAWCCLAASIVGHTSGSRSVNDLIGLGARFLNDDGGATAIEYAIIAGSLSIVILAAVTSVGTALNTTFSSVSTALK